MKSEVEVAVFGQKYTIIGDGEPDYIKKVAQYVDEKMSELAGNMRTATAVQLATLVAINTADELMRSKETDQLTRLREEHDMEFAKVSDWATRSIALIDKEMEVLT